MRLLGLLLGLLGLRERLLALKRSGLLLLVRLLDARLFGCSIGVLAWTAGALAVLNVLELDLLTDVWVKAALAGPAVDVPDGPTGNARLLEDLLVREAIDLEGERLHTRGDVMGRMSLLSVLGLL